MARYIRFGFVVLSALSLAASCRTPETARRDMLRDARKGCDRGEGPACFHAGALTSEEPGGAARAEKLYARGCRLKDVASCDAAWATNGSLRASSAGAGCNAGDLLSCARTAELFAADPARVAEAKELREQTCRMAAVVKPETSARDLEASAEACGGLADMTATGEGGTVDPVLATKLDVLATTLRTEALARLDRAAVADPKAGPKKPSPADADRAARVEEASKTAREALIASIDETLKSPASEAMAPPVVRPTAASVLLWPDAESAAAGGGQCQKCVAGCGDMKLCTGTDDLAGGRCGNLRCKESGPCPPFDDCVAECTAKADACAKACGSCQPTTDEPEPAPAPEGAPSDDAGRCRATGDRIACAVAGARLEKSDPAAALDLYAAGCAKKAEACDNLVVYAASLFRRHEGARAVQVLDKGCELKSGLACTRLAIELERGEHGVPQESSKAARLYDKGCEAGVSRACAGLLSMIEQGRGTPKNAARAKTVRARLDGLDKPPPRPTADPARAAADEEACRKSRDAARCASGGAAVQDIDAVKAEELFRIGCVANKARCGLYAFAVERLRKDDAGRGVRILDQGCQEGAVLACLVLADVSRFGYHAAPRDDQKAAAAWERACDLGDGGACRSAASHARATKNGAKADELRDKGVKADEETEKTERASYEKWLARATAERVREPYAFELERRRADLEAMLEKVRASGATEAAGPADKSSPPAPSYDPSALRQGAIQRMAKELFLAPAAGK